MAVALCSGGPAILSPLPPCLAGQVGRSRYADRLRPCFCLLLFAKPAARQWRARCLPIPLPWVKLGSSASKVGGRHVVTPTFAAAGRNGGRRFGICKERARADLPVAAGAVDRAVSRRRNHRPGGAAPGAVAVDAARPAIH